MAVTISIEFTDGQWELIKQYYPNDLWKTAQEDPIPTDDTVTTVEELAAVLKVQVQARVLKEKKRSEAQNTDAFNV